MPEYSNYVEGRTDADALDGSELIAISQDGSAKKTTTQAIADLGGGAVDSVNGQTGVVVLNAGDVGADPAGSASTVATNLSNHISDTSDAHDASAISFSATGNIAATDLQAAIEELDSEKPSLTSASASTAGGTITLDMSSQVMKMFFGSASFATPKTIAMSNTTNSLVFNFMFEITNVAAVLTVPADWLMSDLAFDGTDWIPPQTGKYELGGSWNGTNWFVKIQGPFS